MEKIGHAWGVSSVWSYGRALDSALDSLHKMGGGGGKGSPVHKLMPDVL